MLFGYKFVLSDLNFRLSYFLLPLVNMTKVINLYSTILPKLNEQVGTIILVNYRCTEYTIIDIPYRD